MIDLKNKLINETSPYLLQHSENPVNWYPWCNDAFEKARNEDKPIFLSIGYSTCHWCHVMAHESFEDEEIAKILNENFISIKVDKEERPDIDSIYMAVCQAFTGSGGWPTSIFMTCEQKPFFAGTYFPKNSSFGMIGFKDLLLNIIDKWHNQRHILIESSEKIVNLFDDLKQHEKGNIDIDLVQTAVALYKQSFDPIYGGFGEAPKFPVPHNLLFLLDYFNATEDKKCLDMVETTLLQMYKGGIFDHIGYGFSRYSTDKFFLVPHFEKMLYDNALLLLSYSKIYYHTHKTIYKDIAYKTADYLIRELMNPEGAFFCAQDADSDGVEGKYYVFDYDEIINILGIEKGQSFNEYYGITKNGNFEGKNIPNLLGNDVLNKNFDELLPKLYDYRKQRTKIHLDDKILTSWNSLLISAFSVMSRVFNNTKYLDHAIKIDNFIKNNLLINNTLYVSYREGKISEKGFLDDYAFYSYGLIELYKATLDVSYLHRAIDISKKAINDFYDTENHGFYLYGKENESLIIKPKETYDGAIPSGNSVMAYNLVNLWNITHNEYFNEIAKNQLAFISTFAQQYPSGYSFYLMSLLEYINPSKTLICVLKNDESLSYIKNLTYKLDLNIICLDKNNQNHKLINNETTYYLCDKNGCRPPTNDIETLFK